MNPSEQNRERKRLAWQAGVLLLVNFVAVACGAIAFLGWISNPAAMVLPALVSFLLSAWQPWLLLWIMPGFARSVPAYFTALTPFLSVPITLAVYHRLSRHGRLLWLRQMWDRYPLRVWVMYAVDVLFLGALVSYAGYKDIPVQHRGVRPTVLWHDDTFAARPFLSDSRYYTLPLFLDEQYLWRVKVPRKKIAGMVHDLGLERVPEKTLPTDFWQQPPVWWNHSVNAVYEEYTYGDFSEKGRRQGGSHAGAAYDPQTETLYVWETEVW